MTTAQITLRHATAADDAALSRLAALDSQALPPGPHLVAESADGLVAALSEYDGRAVADPFQPSASAVQLLRNWSAQRSSRPKTVRALRLRFAGAA